MSTSVIDAFFATLSLDGTLFKKGIKDAENSEKELEQVVNKTNKKIDKGERDLSDARKKRKQERDKETKTESEAVKKIRNELLGLAAIFTAGAGIKGFITNTINGAASLGYLSENLRTSTQDLTAWQKASERAGGSPEGIIAQMKESADTLAQLKSGFGPSEGLQNFFRFGGNADDLKDGNEYLLARSRIISEMFKQDPSKAALISRQMGIAEDQFNFLKQGPAAVMALVQAQEKNAVISMRDAEAAQELRRKWLDLRDSVQATAIKILTASMPALEKLADGILKLTGYVTDNKDVIAGWVDKLVHADWAGLVDDAKSFAKSVRDIADEVKGLLDRWDDWMGRSRIQTPGVTKLPGAIRVGKTEDLDRDNVATGRKPSTSTGRPKNETLAKIGSAIDEGLARTLASFGNKAAGEYIRDTTGKDDYNVGPKITPPSIRIDPPPQQKARTPNVALSVQPPPAPNVALSVQPPPAPNVALSVPRQAAPNVSVLMQQQPAEKPTLMRRNDVPQKPDNRPTIINKILSPAPVVINKDNTGDAPIVVEKLKSMGWTPEQAAGITGSFVQESQLDPNARNSKSGAYGIGQWLGERVKDFEKYTGKRLVGSSLDDQLKFFQYEVTKGKETGVGDQLRAATTAEQTARVHSEAYERPGTDEANISRRQRIAAQLAATDRAANARAVSRVPAAAASASVTNSTSHTNTSTTEIRVENINVQTQATDAQGIAQAMRPAIEKYTFATQANTGMR